MAIQTRYAGDAQGINNVDAKTDGTLGTIVATGLTKNPTALKITTLTGTMTAGESGTGGSVEAILRAIAIDSTVVMYQVDTDRISVLVESTGAGSSDGTTTAAAAIQARIRALTNSANSPTSNIGLTANIYAPLVTVTTSGGIKFA